MKKVIYLLVILLLVNACSQDIPEDNLPLIDGPSVKTVGIADLSAYGIREPGGLLRVGKEFIVADRRNTDNVYRIDLQNRRSEGLYPRVRTRSGNAVILNSLSTDGQGGWTAFDFRSGQLSCGSTVSTRSGENSQIRLPAGRQHLWAIQAGEYVLATGIYPEGRYMLYSPESDRADYFVDYPEHPVFPDLQERTKAILFASNVLRVRPDGRAFICADMYSGIMDVCRIDEGEISLMCRLTYHHPRVKIRERKSWPLVVYSRDNRFGFTDVCVTGQAIYALYSGRTYREDNVNFQHCRTLIKIDWDGQVRRILPVDEAVTHITYDPQEKALYGISRQSGVVLVRLELPEM